MNLLAALGYVLGWLIVGAALVWVAMVWFSI